VVISEQAAVHLFREPGMTCSPRQLNRCAYEKPGGPEIFICPPSAPRRSMRSVFAPVLAAAAAAAVPEVPPPQTMTSNLIGPCLPFDSTSFHL
jgi:hypothetical protein